MDIIIILSLLFAFGSLICGFMLEGGSPAALIQVSALIIVFGGTFGAVGVSCSSKVVRKFFNIMGIAFKKRTIDVKEKIEYFHRLSIKTRKEGLLSLEAESTRPDLDPFIKVGLQLVTDGVELTELRSILETKIEQTSERHQSGIDMFTAAGGYAPTMGIIGTVMGLVLVVSNLSDPTVLGPKIASAFMATLYGIASANLLWLPVANKLKVYDREEIIERELAMEAICLLQQGINPNVLVSKLQAFLTDVESNKFNIQ